MGMENVDSSALDPIATLWHELSDDFGRAQLGGKETSASLLFEVLRREMRTLEKLVDAQVQIDIRMHHGDRELANDRAMDARNSYAALINDAARAVMTHINDLYKLMGIDFSKMDEKQ